MNVSGSLHSSSEMRHLQSFASNPGRIGLAIALARFWRLPSAALALCPDHQPYVDEFTSSAARQVQTHGAPLMPSGVLYTRLLPPMSRPFSSASLI
jgi:hypothetical protein